MDIRFRENDQVWVKETITTYTRRGDTVQLHSGFYTVDYSYLGGGCYVKSGDTLGDAIFVPGDTLATIQEAALKLAYIKLVHVRAFDNDPVAANQILDAVHALDPNWAYDDTQYYQDRNTLVALNRSKS